MERYPCRHGDAGEGTLGCPFRRDAGGLSISGLSLKSGTSGSMGGATKRPR